MPINIVLIEPEIPNNTGNIGRLSLAAGAKLHLVKPFGFELSDKRVKRAGLDYWKHVDLHIYEDKDSFFKQHKDKHLVFLSSHGKKSYTEIEFEDDIFIVFGKESEGLGAELLEKYKEDLFSIPIMSPHVRSLNLANAVSVVVYSCIRNKGI
ncbi:MAG: tRNA (cytidine/uridine-2'-O-)-methyltransferase [Saprospiraceae bacterium]|mgnify:CR=1 FL=1|jgi:tRNA (cytidine/uridine-2'-O-)-methyltransferase|tara:strand:- start:1474 stop:1929 length:456 start_codon:yes stop_codon:yes gene_type:complete